MRQIFLILMLSITLFEVTFAQVDVSCSRKDDMIKNKRSQGQGWIWFVGEGVAFTSEDAFFKASGQALERLKSECGIIPKGAKFHERCIDKNEDTFHAYVRVSITDKLCNRSSGQLVNKYLEEKLSNYQDIYILKKKNVNKKKCQKERPEECFLKAVKSYDKGYTDQSLRLFRESCQYGHSKSCHNIGIVLYHEKHYDDAISFLLKSCGEDEKQSCHLASLIFFDSKKIEDARKYAKQACYLGENKSCYNLAMTSASKKTRRSLLSSSCEKGHGQSCHALGLDIFDLGLKNSSLEAYKYFVAACEKYSVLKSCYNAALVTKDSKKAKELFEHSCRMGLPQSCKKLK